MRNRKFVEVKDLLIKIMSEVFGETIVSELHCSNPYSEGYYLEFMDCKIDAIFYKSGSVKFNFEGDNKINGISQQGLLNILKSYYKG